MRIFLFTVFLSLGGALSAQVPEPKPKAPVPVRPPAAAKPKPPAQVKPAATPSPAAAPAQGFDKVVLTVGNEKMTAGEFDKFVDALPEQYRAAAKGPGKRQVAEQLMSHEDFWPRKPANGSSTRTRPTNRNSRFKPKTCLAGRSIATSPAI